MHTLGDLRLAIRGLRRSPLFTTVAILSLALGIGANSAIFTLIDQILLRKLPVRAPEELVMLYQRGSHNGSNMGSRMNSYPIYMDYMQKGAPLSQVICRRLAAASVSIDNRTERLDAELVSGNYFTMLGVAPAAGRVFNSREDDQVFMGHPVVVLSHDYWESRFARDPNVVGKKILVNNYPMTIVGVSAAGFSGVDPATSPAIRVPILMKEALLPEWTWVHVQDRRTRWVQVFGRLKPGYTVQTAQPPMQTLFTQIRAVRDDAAGGEGLVEVLPRTVHEGAADRREGGHRVLGPQERLLDGARGADVHGWPRAAHRVRQRREPADRARLHASA